AAMALAAAALRRRKKLAALPAAALILAAGYWQFSTVEPRVNVPARWQIGERGVKTEGNPEELLVKFQLGRDESISIYSNDLARYLTAKG
ncbi:hypothetical protein ABTK15_20105, partial [Acinetobacter baumannii]